MADITIFIASVAWLVLAIIQAKEMDSWNKKFSELYEELRKQIEEDA